MIEITAPAADGSQEFRYNGETLVRLASFDSVHGFTRYTVAWSSAIGYTFRDAGEAFGAAYDRAVEMAEDVDTRARLAADMRY